MKFFFTLILTLLFLSAFSQADYQYLNVQRRFTLANRTVKGISNDTAWLVGYADSLVTQYAVQGYISNNFSRGGSFAYNFNPEQFIQNGQDISIRFPQDPGEPLFTGSPAFNFTQQHLDFLDSLMLAVGQDTYLDDRDFYYSSDTLNPIRWKAFTFSTTGTGAASWDSANRHLNIPVSSGSGGSSTPYRLPYNGDTSYYLAGDTSLRKLPTVKNADYKLPYNGDSTFYLAGDSTLHPLPPTPPPGDSIDYSFTALTTVYNEYGPGEYAMGTNNVSANPDNTNFPFRQLKAIDIGGWTSSSYISFTKNTTFSTTAFTFLRAFIRLKSVVDVPSSLSFRFYLNGVPISSLISCVNYGLIKNKVGTYMNISIPLTAFGFTSNNFDELRFEFGGSNSTGIYLDLVQLQNATIDENKYVTDIHRIPGTLTVQQVLGGVNTFAYTDSIGISDTSLLHAQLVQQLAAIQANTANILLKLNTSDTAAMLSHYLRVTDTTGRWAAKVHTHAESDVTNLVSDLAGKEPLIAAGITLQYWRGDKTWQSLNTTAVAEGTNLYYTNTRARAAISLTANGTSGAATYNSTTGVLNVPNYNSIPTLTTGSVIFRGANGLSESNNKFYYDSANVRLNINGASTPNRINILSTANAREGITVTNTSNGDVGMSEIRLINDLGKVGALQQGSSQYNGLGAMNRTVLASTGSISIVSNADLNNSGLDSVNIYAGGLNTVPVAIFKPNGNTYIRDTLFARVLSVGGTVTGGSSGGSSYTDAQARAAVSLTTVGTSGAATYNSSTGVFNIPQYTTGGTGGSGTWTGPLALTYSDNNFGAGITVKNSSTGTQALTSINLLNSSGTATGSLIFVPGNYAAPAQANSVLMQSLGANKLGFNSSGDLGANHADIYFRSGNSTDAIHVFGSTNNIGINTATDVSSAALNIVSTTKGVLFPRMTTTQRDAISGVVEGLTIYNLTTHQNETYNGTLWAH